MKKSTADELWELSNRLREASMEVGATRVALIRCRTVLENMAKENESWLRRLGWRWQISDEPLRADAKNLLPQIAAALGELE